MAEGRVRDEWRRTSVLLALTANCHRDPKKTKAFRPADFDPFREPEKPIRVDITVLKDVFIDRQMPGYGGPGEFE
ncbi:MAG: hypothetical protein HZB38_16655 [Planctomycetes bacterium]|nr:hypothetical protein [Planctomycetota bacterium]